MLTQRSAEESRGSKKQRACSSVSSRIDEAIVFLQYDHNTDVSVLKNSSEVCHFLEATTRALGDQLYGQEKTSADTLRRWGRGAGESVVGVVYDQCCCVRLPLRSYVREHGWSREERAAREVSYARGVRLCAR